LFFRAQSEQAVSILEIIDTYASATGQLINYDKCSITFGGQCPMEVQEQVKGVLQVHVDGSQEKYLGLPTPEGRMHKGRFQNLQEKLTKRIMVWGDGYPSQGGKEMLIKAIAQAIPTYLMGVFKSFQCRCATT
jgi:hypothetical protein